MLGAGCGFFLLWGIAEAGRLLFGRFRVRFSPPVRVFWRREDRGIFLKVDGDEWPWEDFFFRGSETIVWQATEGVGKEGTLPAGEWRWSEHELRIGARTIALKGQEEIEAVVKEAVFPREVMGFGDVKLLGTIGAFLGWKAVFFVLTAGATLGAIVGSISVIAGRREWAARLPFGPYLAAGAVWWFFAGEATLRQYWKWMDWGR
jgi:leader peptidase (prepilin peptidase)/N-methyltransferase